MTSLFDVVKLRVSGDSLIVTIPRRVYEAVGLSCGDRVVVTTNDDGEIRLIPEGKAVLSP